MACEAGSYVGVHGVINASPMTPGNLSLRLDVLPGKVPGLPLVVLGLWVEIRDT